MTYTLTENPNIIIRDEDQAFIPIDPDNIDYQDYFAWHEEGQRADALHPAVCVQARAQERMRRFVIALAFTLDGCTSQFAFGPAAWSDRRAGHPRLYGGAARRRRLHRGAQLFARRGRGRACGAAASADRDPHHRA